MPSADPTVITGLLAVPGARLYHEVRGTGAPVLLIPGGPMDASGFTAVAVVLAARYTVITYDPRGLSRSRAGPGRREIAVERQADDAHLLLQARGAWPAHVFASSGGALTGLALVARHPEDVRTMVVHEPPITELLPDRAVFRQLFRDLVSLHRADRVGSAMIRFLTASESASRGGARPPPTTEANLDVFFGQMLRSITFYRPDLTALCRAPARIVVAAGTAAAGQVAHRCAEALAAALGTEVLDLPGDHAGFADDPQQLADLLDRQFEP